MDAKCYICVHDRKFSEREYFWSRRGYNDDADLCGFCNEHKLFDFRHLQRRLDSGYSCARYWTRMRVDLRRPTEEDLARFRECLAADADHALQDADTWITPPGEFMTFYDEAGNRLWVRIEKVLRISIQHDQDVPLKALPRLLHQSFAWLFGAARNSQFTEIIFESRAKRLIQFVKKHFGVEPVTDNYHVWAVEPAKIASSESASVLQ